MNELLKLQNVSYSYKSRRVLQDVSFELPVGSITGLLGPNGYGKTTLIKIIAGLINDQEGGVHIDGQPVGVESKSVVSYLPEKTYFEPGMKGNDAVKYFADFYADFDQARACAMMERFGIERGQLIKQMSKGTQEKLQLILVMARKARLYLLDEPLGGIDPAAREAMLDIILQNYTDSASVIISTHLIADVERIFDRVLFLKDGRLTVDEEVDALRERTGKSVLEYFLEVYAC